MDIAFLKTMERYEIVKDIGAGNFAVAKLVRDKWTKELFAVKFIERGLKVTPFPLSIQFPAAISFSFSVFFLCCSGKFKLDVFSVFPIWVILFLSSGCSVFG